jgi:hypothetical protein
MGERPGEVATRCIGLLELTMRDGLYHHYETRATTTLRLKTALGCHLVGNRGNNWELKFVFNVASTMTLWLHMSMRK